MKKEILKKIIDNQKSLVVNGDVASGKTISVCFPLVNEMVNKKESLFILDSREEYINNYYNLLKENGYNIIIINLRNLSNSENWNPLEYPYSLYKQGDKDKAQEYIEKIGKVIFHENSTCDSYWIETASDFFTGIALGLFEDGKKEEISINSINNMFNGIDLKFGTSDCLTTYFGLKSKTSAPYVFASPTFLAPRDTKGSILSTARQKLRPFVSRERFSKLLNVTSFSWDKVLNKPTAIMFVNRDENKTLNSLVAMFIEQLYSILIDNKLKSKFNFILDNFDSIEKINEFEEMIGSSSSRNIKFVIGTRSIGKLNSNYGKYMIGLCNTIAVNDDKLKISINNENILEEKSFSIKSIKNCNIVFPKLIEKEVKYFDIQKYVQKKDRVNSFEEKDNNYSIDKLIKKIDDKIEQIEQKEQKAMNNSGLDSNKQKNFSDKEKE